MSSYDLAVTKYVLSASESYVTCLSSKCGLQFSVEDCHKEKGSRNSITCPYCEHEICLKCNRPWNSHGRGGCDEAKKAEDAESIATVKKMGAKPCPQCGMNIEKFGGCDHMKCKSQVTPNGIKLPISTQHNAQSGCRLNHKFLP